jgi:hypothetical protein
MPHYVFSALAWDVAATPRRGPTSRAISQTFQTIQLFIQECASQIGSISEIRSFIKSCCCCLKNAASTQKNSIFFEVLLFYAIFAV